MTFRRLARDVVIYGSGGVVLQLLAFLTVPIFTRIFVPADYGVIETMTTIVAIAGIFAVLGLDSAAQRSYFDYPSDAHAEQRSVLSTAFWTITLASVTTAAVGIALSGWISSVFFPDDRFATVIALAFAAVPLGTTTAFCQEVLRMRHRPAAYTAIAITAGAISVGLALVLVASFDRGLTGYYLGFVVGGAAAVSLGLVLVHGALGFTANRAKLRVMLAYGLPLIPVALSTWVLLLADRFFLLHFSGLTDLGLYGLAVRLASLLSLAVTALSLAWAPLMLELHRQDPEEERTLRARTLTYATVILSFGAVIISVFAREFFETITGPDYEEAYKGVGLLSLGIVMVGLNSITMSGIAIARRTTYFARYAVYALVVNTALNFALIPPFSVVGAALSTFLSFAFLAALYYHRAQQLGNAPFDGRRIVTTLAAAGVVIAAGQLLVVDPVWLGILVKLPLLAAFPLLLFAFGVVDRETIRFVRATVGNLASRGSGE